MGAADFFVKRDRRYVTLSIQYGLRLLVISAVWLSDCACWVTCSFLDINSNMTFAGNIKSDQWFDAEEPNENEYLHSGNS